MSRAEVLAALQRFRIQLPRVLPRGPAGERLGRGTGSSLEFQDYRSYAPGDDLRHVDWTAYARTDELLVRLYREEISPRVEILVDTSASMASTPAKREKTLDLLEFLLESCRAERVAVDVWHCGVNPRKQASEELARLRDLQFEGGVSLDGLLRRPPKLAHRALRIVISDLLFPVEARPLVRILGRNATSLMMIQILDVAELEPDFEGGFRLTDCESGMFSDLVVTDAMTAEYRRRLGKLQESWRLELQRMGAAIAICSAALSLDEILRTTLRPAGFVEVRGVA